LKNSIPVFILALKNHLNKKKLYTMDNSGAKHFVSPSVRKIFEDDEDYRKQIDVFKKFGFDFF